MVYKQLCFKQELNNAYPVTKDVGFVYLFLIGQTGAKPNVIGMYVCMYVCMHRNRTSCKQDFFLNPGGH